MKKPSFSWGEARALACVAPSIVLLVIILCNADWSSNFYDFKDRAFETPQIIRRGQVADSVEVAEIVLSPFDPNTATFEEFRALGLSASTAAGVVKYRERGKRFEIPEDFATCYGITDSIYAVLKPYIIIGEEFKLKPFERTERAEVAVSDSRRERMTPAEKATAYLTDHLTINPNILTADDWVALGCSVRQAEAVAR